MVLCITLDPPRKRVDSHSSSSPHFQAHRARCCQSAKFPRFSVLHTLPPLSFRSHSIGSANLDQLPPRSPRLSITTTPNYSPSAGGYYTYNSSTPPPSSRRKASYGGAELTSTLQPMPVPGSPWKRKLSQTMKSFVVSPRFHRKKYDGKFGVSDAP